ncbi:HIT domain-containing protein [Priestia megaterium]
MLHFSYLKKERKYDGNPRIDCLGCRLANSQEKSHIIFEDSFVTCLLDHKPFNEGHVLILPKNI